MRVHAWGVQMTTVTLLSFTPGTHADCLVERRHVETGAYAGHDDDADDSAAQQQSTAGFVVAGVALLVQLNCGVTLCLACLGLLLVLVLALVA